MAGQGITELPIQTALDWQEIQVKHFQLVVQDTRKADYPRHELAKCLKVMHEVIAAGGAVYVHCKAGITRSATVVYAYLAKHGNADNLPLNSNREAILNYLRNLRDVVTLRDLNFDVAKGAIEILETMSGQPLPAKNTVLKNIDGFLQTSEAKSQLVQFAWFKELKNNALRDRTLLATADNILNKLNRATTLKDFHEALDLHEGKVFFNEKTNLFLELIEHLAKIFNYRKDDILRILSTQSKKSEEEPISPAAHP